MLVSIYLSPVPSICIHIRAHLTLLDRRRPLKSLSLICVSYYYFSRSERELSGGAHNEHNHLFVAPGAATLAKLPRRSMPTPRRSLSTQGGVLELLDQAHREILITPNKS
jgi:hypothetical protein